MSTTTHSEEYRGNRIELVLREEDADAMTAEQIAEWFAARVVIEKESIDYRMSTVGLLESARADRDRLLAEIAWLEDKYPALTEVVEVAVVR